jgi:hypothetical protein
MFRFLTIFALPTLLELSESANFTKRRVISFPDEGPLESLEPSSSSGYLPLLPGKDEDGIDLPLTDVAWRSVRAVLGRPHDIASSQNISYDF